jgi:hypothetical protein
MIDITGVDLVKFVKKAYELSGPQGLGFLHAKGGSLTDEETQELIRPTGRIALSMDYVHGRACKMTVFREGDRLEIRDTWYDHSDLLLERLLGAFDLKKGSNVEHSISCNCVPCQQKRCSA